jgi:hypothetical protein
MLVILAIPLEDEAGVPPSVLLHRYPCGAFLDQPINHFSMMRPHV